MSDSEESNKSSSSSYVDDSSEDESYDEDDDPRTWKQYLKYDEAKKKKEIVSQQRSILMQQEQIEKDSVATVHDPLGVSHNKHKFSNRLSEWDVAKKDNSKDISISRETFSPSLFLAIVHKHSTLDELANGRGNLTKDQKRIEGKMRDLIEKNMSKFIESKDAVDAIHKQKDSKFKDNSLQNLEMQYKLMQERSSDLFDPLIKRKKEGDGIKDALQYLRKFGFIFNIPSNIAIHIQKKEYKKIVHDYNKAQFFKQKCGDDVALFNPIFESVATQVASLRTTLFDQLILKEQDADNIRLLTEEEERIIGLLNSLDCDIDPAWFYMNEIYRYIKRQIEICLADHFVTLRELHLKQVQLKNLESKWRQISMYGEEREIAEDLDTRKSTSDEEDFSLCSQHERELETLKLIKDMGSILTFVLPDFHKLCQSIVSGKFRQKSQRTEPIRTKNGLLAHSEVESHIESLFKDIFDSYASKVNSALDMIDNGSAHQKIFCHCIEKVIESYEYLLPIIPHRYLKDLQEFSDTRRRLTINEVWKRTNFEISCFYQQEDWKAVSASQSYTSLPLKFQEHVFKTINLLKPFIRSRDSLLEEVQEYLVEASLVFADCLHHLAFQNTNHTATTSKRIRKAGQKELHHHKENQLLSILSNCYHTKTVIIPDIVFAFISAFKNAKESKKEEHSDVTKSEQSSSNAKKPSLKKDKDSDSEEDEETESDSDSSSSSSNSSSSSDSDEDSEFLLDEDDASLKEETEVSHKSVSEREILKLATQFQSKEEFKAVLQVYDTLCSFVIYHFVRKKIQTLTYFVEKGLLLSGYNWGKAPVPTEIQPFILEVLLELSITHSRVEHITMSSVLTDSSKVSDTPSSTTEVSSESFTKIIFSKISERLAEVFVEYISSLQGMSHYAGLQLDINISFVRKALRNFETKRAKSIYNNLSKLMEGSGYDKKANECVKLKESIISSTAQQTSVQLDCFDISKDMKVLVKGSSGIGLRQRSLSLLRMTF